MSAAFASALVLSLNRRSRSRKFLRVGDEMSRRPKSVRVKSVMLRAEQIVPIEIEIQVVAGVPGLQFVGLPEAGLKESSVRLRSAIRTAGFRWPKGNLVLVDVRPRSERKHGRGLDLAVAIAYLALSGQLPNLVVRQLERAETIFYGDVNLDGSVTAPADWERVRALVGGEMVTGEGPQAGAFRAGPDGEGLFCLSHLGAIEQPLPVLSGRTSAACLPDGERLDFEVMLEEVPAQLARIAAAGGHSILLAGPQGTGKSTMGRLLHRLAPELTSAERQETQRWSSVDTRPLVEPHHSAGALAMVGGGRPPRPGAITRAHRGILLMDEVLCFRPDVQEALREPIETGWISIARGPDEKRFPADFQMVGTTNLCACGRLTPIAPEDCLCSSRKRVQFEDRLRGPFVDRFQMLAFTTGWSPSKGRVAEKSLRADVLRARLFAQKLGRPDGNKRWRPERLSSDLLGLLPTSGSERRRLSVLRLARTIADLDEREELNARDIFEAKEWALSTFQWLAKGVEGFTQSLPI